MVTNGVRILMPISQFSLSVGATTDSIDRIISNYDLGGGRGWRLLPGTLRNINLEVGNRITGVSPMFL